MGQQGKDKVAEEQERHTVEERATRGLGFTQSPTKVLAVRLRFADNISQAVKEFSKSRLRKRAQSNLLRRPNGARRPGHLAAGIGFNSPLHRTPASIRGRDAASNSNSLDLIKEEIAIMKKLDHPNLVSLIEVLDDPAEDSLYMVMEMCKKGIVMKVSLEERAEPYPEEVCRCWFRDLILGIEYLHAQGIIHRDLKPDNCLITADDVLKVVDFGVSEMFDKQGDNPDADALVTAKSAGSPAFMPPELCVVKHGAVSGRAADIWSMGVTLFCLRYGRIPFEKSGVLELYESIRAEEIDLSQETDPVFCDLMTRLLDKDPERRITMAELREHPWVTANGADPLLPAEENCATIIEPPTASEMDHAITGNMENLLVVMKAVRRFKDLLPHNRRSNFMSSILGRDSRISAPPEGMSHPSEEPNPSLWKTKSALSGDSRLPLDGAAIAEGVHRVWDRGVEILKSPSLLRRGFTDRDQAASGAAQSSAIPSIPATSEGAHSPGLQASASSPLAHAVTAVQDSEDTKVGDETTRGRALTIEEEDHGSRPHESAASAGPQHTQSLSPPPRLVHAHTFPDNSPDLPKGHAHDPLADTLFLNVGAGTSDPYIEPDPRKQAVPSPRPSITIPNADDNPVIDEPEHDPDAPLIISESPPGLDDDEANIYETAYQEEMRRILAAKQSDAVIHLTRRVDHLENLKAHPNVAASSINHGVDFARRRAREAAKWMNVEKTSAGLADIVRRAADRAAEKGLINATPADPSESDFMRGGTVDKEDHIPTNETAPGGADSTTPAGASATQPLKKPASLWSPPDRAATIDGAMTTASNLTKLASDVAGKLSMTALDAGSKATHATSAFIAAAREARAAEKAQSAEAAK